jgi:hypothetical protein
MVGNKGDDPRTGVLFGITRGRRGKEAGMTPSEGRGERGSGCFFFRTIEKLKIGKWRMQNDLNVDRAPNLQSPFSNFQFSIVGATPQVFDRDRARRTI